MGSLTPWWLSLSESAPVRGVDRVEERARGGVAWALELRMHRDRILPAITLNILALCSAPSMPRCCAPTAMRSSTRLRALTALPRNATPGSYVMAGEIYG